MDCLFYQSYGCYGEQQAAMDRWSELTGKPLFNGDSSYSVPNETMPNPLGPHCESQEERARLSEQLYDIATGNRMGRQRGARINLHLTGGPL